MRSDHWPLVTADEMRALDRHTIEDLGVPGEIQVSNAALAMALAVGLAYAGQELDAVPHDGNDQRLDWIVTEREAIEIL